MSVAHFRDDTIQLIKDTADIVEIIGENVNLKKNGVNFKGLCPFHSEKTPSFMVNPERRSFHCFGCGEGGDVLSFMMKFHRLSFHDALKELARRYQINLPQDTLSPADQERTQKRRQLADINDRAAALFHDLLLHSPSAEKARRYLENRGIPLEVVKTFRLGYAPDSWDFLTSKLESEFPLGLIKDTGLIVPRAKSGFYDRFRNRILFPISSASGKIVGFGGRILGEGQPKYLNTPETMLFDKSRTLFGLYQNKDSIRKENICIVVEGNFDLLALVACGISNVVAPLGTALTQNHVRAIKAYAEEVILLFDGDSAGLKAAMRTAPLFLTEQMTARISVLPENHDPDSYVREHGREGIGKLLDNAMSLPEFIFARLVKQFGLSLEGKSKIVSELQPLVKAIGDNYLQRTVFINHFSNKLGITPEQLEAGLRAPKEREFPTAKQNQANLTRLSRKEEQLLKFLVIYTEYLNDFLEAGLDDIIASDFGRSLLAPLRAFVERGVDSGPDALLEMTTGDERSFISEVLVSAPFLSEELKEAEAAEKISWLRKLRLEIKKQRLIEQINEAHLSRNEALWMELMEEKKKIDEAFASY